MHTDNRSAVQIGHGSRPAVDLHLSHIGIGTDGVVVSSEPYIRLAQTKRDNGILSA